MLIILSPSLPTIRLWRVENKNFDTAGKLKQITTCLNYQMMKSKHSPAVKQKSNTKNGFMAFHLKYNKTAVFSIKFPKLFRFICISIGDWKFTENIITVQRVLRQPDSSIPRNCICFIYINVYMTHSHMINFWMNRETCNKNSDLDNMTKDGFCFLFYHNVHPVQAPRGRYNVRRIVTMQYSYDQPFMEISPKLNFNHPLHLLILRITWTSAQYIQCLKVRCLFVDRPEFYCKIFWT